MESPSLPPRRKSSIGLLPKFTGIGLIALPLLLAALAVYGLLLDRQGHRSTAMIDIQQGWGSAQEITGPFLVVPLEPGKNGGAPFAILAATESDFSLETQSVERYRGIHSAWVYAAQASAQAHWTPPADLDTDLARADWGEAQWVFTVSDPRVLADRPQATVAGESVKVAAALGQWGLDGGFRIPAVFDAAGGSAIELALKLRGSERLGVRPGALRSTVAMSGDWPHPSFAGPWLPAEREVYSDSYYANWNLHEFSAGQLPLLYSADDGSIRGALQTAQGPEVEFLVPVDPYRLVERAIKHAGLVVALVFSAFLFFDLRDRLRLHPVQYLFVGATVALFLLLLLALGEALPIGLAYSLASLLSIVLVCGYARAILRVGSRAWSMAGVQLAIYGLLYVVLRMESLALIAGSLALAGALGALMWLTRDLDWNALGAAKDELAEGEA